MNISVVIPALNDAPMLRRCLAALADQKVAPFEVIVVDNGSTDDTAEVARAAGARVVYQPIKGIPRASSTGYDAARGDIIARIDADSLCPPSWTQRIAETFEHDPELTVYTGMGRFYGGSKRTHWMGEHLYLGGMYFFITPYLGHPPIFGSNFAMRRDAWLEIGPEFHRAQANIHDDLDLSFHIKPWMNVRYDPTFVVAISARPFDSFSAFKRRLSWVLPTVANHWPQDAPWRRRAERRRWSERDLASAGWAESWHPDGVAEPEPWPGLDGVWADEAYAEPDAAVPWDEGDGERPALA